MRVAKILTVCLFFAEAIALLYEGDACKLTETAETGECIKLDSCDYAMKLLQSKKIPETCGFVKQMPLVCCPKNSQVISTPTRSEEKCQEVYDLRTQRYSIAGGKKAVFKEFPHMVALGYVEDENSNKSNFLWLCGASLISDRFVLSAAHCAHSRNYGQPKQARLGELDLNDTTDGAAPEDFAIVQIIVHPDYKMPSYYNDIALMKLEKQVYFGRSIKPACLHTKKEIPNYTLQATGWGQTDFIGGDSSSHLLKVNLTLIDNEKCNKLYEKVTSRRLKSGIIDDSQICAGDVTGKDTCPGDSGGPLHFLQPQEPQLLRHFVVVGVTSFGDGCGFANSAGVYTRVSSYVPWIENIVWPLYV